MILTAILIGLWALMLAGPDTPIGRGMHRLLVALPCRKLAAISRGQVLLTVLLLTIMTVLVWLFENDGRMLVMMGMPEVMGFAAAIDLSALLDLAVVAVIAAGTVRVRAVRAWLARRVAGRPSARRRAIRVRRPSRPANDDGDRPGLALAA